MLRFALLIKQCEIPRFVRFLLVMGDEVSKVKRDSIVFVLGTLCFAVGCAPAESVIPTDPLTAEQIAAIQAEDAAVADEESGGNYQKHNAKQLKKARGN